MPPLADCCAPERMTTVAWPFFSSFKRQLQDVIGRGQTERHVDDSADLRIQSTAWTNYYIVLTDTACTEKWVVFQ
jgi:hypothetical protein